MPDVLPGQGFGRVVLGLYVCHVIIIIEGPFCLPRRGAFVFMGPQDNRGVCHVGGQFSTIHQP